MSSTQELAAASRYQESLGYERAANAAMQVCQWRVAAVNFREAAALVAPDPHGGRHIDARRYERWATVCDNAARGAFIPMMVRENQDYYRTQREARRRIEREFSQGYL